MKFHLVISPWRGVTFLSQHENDLCKTWNQNELLKDQLLEVNLKHEIECCVLLSHECVDNSLQDEIEKIQRGSIEIQEGMQKRINIFENDVQRCQKQSLDFELKLQHEKEKSKYESSLKNVCETSWISKMEKLESENVSLEFHTSSNTQQAVGTNKNVIAPGMYKVDKKQDINTNKAKSVLSFTGLGATSSVRIPSNKDSSFKNSVLSNTKNSSEQVEVSDRTNKKPDVASKNVDLDKKIVINYDIKNALIAKNVLCVSCAKNVLIPCHDNCLVKYKLNVLSRVRRALFTTSKIVKSKFKDTTPVVSKTKFSVKTVQFESLDTTPAVSKTKIVAVTHLSAKNKVVQIVLWIVDSGCSKHMTGDHSLLKNFVEKFMGTVRFRNDHFAAITGYGDYVQGNITGKSKKVSHLPKLVPSSHSNLELLHMDLCGPMRVASINGKKYIHVIVDDYSRFTWVYFLHLKDETPKIIKKFIAQVQLNSDAKIHRINDTEFKNATLKDYYEKL
ncbi:integrase, catalytic region, zinc finger, CCHC-type containing protein, partial [Tanacetum coccineum]